MVLVGLESIVVVSHSVMMNKTFVVDVVALDEDDDDDDDDRDGIVDAVVTTLAMGMVVSLSCQSDYIVQPQGIVDVPLGEHDGLYSVLPRVVYIWMDSLVVSS